MDGPRYRAIPGEPASVVAYGTTLPELFEHAGFAMFDLRFVLDDVAPRYSRPVVAAGDTTEDLLLGWLEELHAMSRVEGLALSYFTVDRLEEGGVQGSAAGLPLAVAPRRAPGIEAPPTRPLTVVAIPDGWWVRLDFVPARIRPV